MKSQIKYPLHLAIDAQGPMGILDDTGRAVAWFSEMHEPANGYVWEPEECTSPEPSVDGGTGYYPQRGALVRKIMDLIEQEQINLLVQKDLLVQKELQVKVPKKFAEASIGKSTRTKLTCRTLPMPNMPGEGWILLKENDKIKPGDGFWHPEANIWISFECRPNMFRGDKQFVHTWPWRRKIKRQAAKPKKHGH